MNFQKSKPNALFSLMVTLFMIVGLFINSVTNVYAAEIDNVASAIQVENKYNPTIKEKNGVITEVYKVSSGDLDILNSIYLADNIAPRSWGSDIPRRSSTTSGSFKVSSVVSFAGAIAGIFGAGFFVSAAGVVADSVGLGGNVYYVYTHTSWRTDGVLYVQGKMDFYKDAGHRQYITSTYHNREYSNNMMD